MNEFHNNQDPYQEDPYQRDQMNNDGNKGGTYYNYTNTGNNPNVKFKNPKKVSFFGTMGRTFVRKIIIRLIIFGVILLAGLIINMMSYVTSGKGSMADYFGRFGINIGHSISGQSGLYNMIASHDIAKLEKFLMKDVDLNKESEDYPPAIYTAILTKNYKAIPVLVEHGADINLQSQIAETASPIFYAIYDEDVTMIETLIENGADLTITDPYGKTPLLAAITMGEQYFDATLAGGGDIYATDLQSWTSLHYAASYGTVKMYQQLLDLGLEESAVTVEGYGVGHLALTNPDFDLFMYLKEKGIEPTQPTLNGDTLLHLVASDEAARYVMENYECDYTLKNSSGVTPLHRAMLFLLSEDIINLYIQNGADVNAQTSEGLTPLMYAETDAMVEILLANGADTKIKDVYGYVAKDYLEFYLDDGISQEVLDQL